MPTHSLFADFGCQSHAMYMDTNAMPWERDPGSEARFSAFVDEATMKEPELQYYGAWRIMPSEDRMRLWKTFTNGHGKDMMEGKASSFKLQVKNATQL